MRSSSIPKNFPFLYFWLLNLEFKIARNLLLHKSTCMHVKKKVVCVFFKCPNTTIFPFFLMCKKRSMKSMHDALNEMEVIF